jgi:hypothetical protein
VCFQDSIHLCTKLRNRLLSPTTTLLMGKKYATMDHLLQLIDNCSKLDHGLTVSDVLQKDRQNFSSCEKISSESVLSLLKKVPNSEATQAYLQVKISLLSPSVWLMGEYDDRTHSIDGSVVSGNLTRIFVQSN